VMAYILDWILLGPIFLSIAGYLDLPIDDISDPRALWMVLLWASIEFPYKFGMEWAFGWTLGKRILGLRVAGLDGRRLSLQGALVRNLIRLIDCPPTIGMLIGIGMLLKTKRRQRLGDWLGRTIVVR